MSKSLSLQFPSVPVNSKQQGLIELYKDAYIQKKVNKDKLKQDSLDSIYTKILNELKKQKIEEIHITSAREEADKIAHDEFIRIYFDVYKDLLLIQYKNYRVNIQRCIKEYLNARDDHLSPLFIRHNVGKNNIDILEDENMRLTRFFITGMIKKYSLQALILKNISAHTLRHSFATTLL